MIGWTLCLAWERFGIKPSGLIVLAQCLIYHCKSWSNISNFTHYHLQVYSSKGKLVFDQHDLKYGIWIFSETLHNKHFWNFQDCTSSVEASIYSSEYSVVFSIVNFVVPTIQSILCWTLRQLINLILNNY